MEKTVERMYLNGKRGEPVGAQIVTYPNGAAVATVEQDKATQGQFLTALKRNFPRYRFQDGGSNGSGYWLVYGELSWPTT